MAKARGKKKKKVMKSSKKNKKLKGKIVKRKEVANKTKRKVTKKSVKKIFPRGRKRSKKLKPTKKKIRKQVKQITKANKVRKLRKDRITRKKVARGRDDRVKLERAIHNPIIVPRLYPWESKATFNPAAFSSRGKVHIIYRAIGEDDSSSFGYASSFDGYNIAERPTHFVYNRLMGKLPYGKFISYDSGGGWNGGCEDPRLALLGSTIYMLYTAFDGWGSLRIAMTSIKLSDFEKKKWKWEKPVLISPPGEIHKNWVIFPEKIKGKFAILHSISPQPMVEYVDSMDEFDGKKFIKSYHGHSRSQENSWDNWVRGVGPTPIKTSMGWLVLYHAMDNNDPDRYKLGAMILDASDPTLVLYRSSQPILEPDEHYENHGHKWGVIYSCGAVVKDGELIVYYGGADRVSCVASITLAELLEDLKKDKVIKLKEKKLVKIK